MKHIIITGHYGSGKSNIAVNMALSLKSEKPVYLIDADIVNPYFRSADNKDILEKNGIRLIAPLYANTNLDIPALPAEIQQVFKKDCVAVWDIGGDDAGAIVLGRYAADIAEQGYEMFYVLNFYRPLTEDLNETTSLLYDIERASTLRMTALINNSNLGTGTKPDDVYASIQKAKEFAEKCGLPVKMTTVSSELRNSMAPNGVRFIDILTKKYW